jgi:hypothetical protein
MQRAIVVHTAGSISPNIALFFFGVSAFPRITFGYYPTANWTAGMAAIRFSFWNCATDLPPDRFMEQVHPEFYLTTFSTK